MKKINYSKSCRQSEVGLLSKEEFERVLKDPSRKALLNEVKNKALELFRAKNSGATAAVVAECEAAHKAAKERVKALLPVIIPMATFPEGVRDDSKAVPTGLVMLDFDHIGEPTAWYSSHGKGREQELGIVYSHITPSYMGVRIIARIPKEMYKDLTYAGEEIVRAQQWLAAEVDGETDKACKNYGRCSFITCDDYTLYPADGNFEALFEDIDVPEIVICPKKEKKAKAKASDSQVACPAEVTPDTVVYGTFTAREITDKWFEMNGGVPQKDRNIALHKFAVNMLSLVDNNPEALKALMPDVGLDSKEVDSIIRSACKEEKKGITRGMKAVLKALAEDSREEAWATLPKMPTLKEIPKSLAAVLKPIPEKYRPAVLMFVFTPLAAHLKDVTFRYVDNTLHEATISTFLLAETGAGKECVTRPTNLIMKDIDDDDDLSRCALEEYNDSVARLGANTEKPERPKVCIRHINPDTTSAAYLQRQKDADGAFLYMRVNEVQQLYNIRNASGKPAIHELICANYDYGNRLGSERVGVNSVNATVTVRLLLNVTTTPGQAMKFFKSVLVDGPVSRISVCTIPEDEIGSEIPVYGDYTEDLTLEIRKATERLVRAEGTAVKCKQLTDFGRTLVNHMHEVAAKADNPVYYNLGKRACVSAFLRAGVMYIMNGCKWTKTIETTAMYTFDYDMACKMNIFGGRIEAATQAERAEVSPLRVDNLLAGFPKKFDKDFISEFAKKTGKPKHSVQKLIFRWKKSGYVKRNSDGIYTRVV